MCKPIIVKTSISDTVEILGHTVDGYKAILKAVEYAASPGSTMINGRGKEMIISKPYISTREPALRIPGLHILEVYERYPCFDSSDYTYEDRYFRNYFFSDKPFTRDKINQIAYMKRVGNLEFINDNMPDWSLPSAYYKGEGDEIIYAF